MDKKHIINCLYCGNKASAKNNMKKFCTSSHRQLYYQKNKKNSTVKSCVSSIYSEVKSLLYKEQQNKCGICQKNELECGEFVIDHCHKTNKIRGLLCGHCNMLLGIIKDDKGYLYNTIKYLDNSTNGEWEVKLHFIPSKKEGSQS